MIEFDLKEKVFHLKNNEISYVIGILENGHLGHFYFGKKLSGPLMSNMFRIDQNKGLTSNVFENNPSFSLNNERLEYPCYGSTDFREPAFDFEDKDGSHIYNFKYSDYEILSGKPSIDLPSSYGLESEASTLRIKLKDKFGLEITLSYTIFESLNIIARHTQVRNTGNEVHYIDRLMSLSMDLKDSNWEMMQFSGDWIRERHQYVTPLRPGIQSVYSHRGASSANHHPSLILKRLGANETQGEAIGMTLMYSGNHLIQCEVDSNSITRVMGGISPSYFKWKLQPNEMFQSPEMLLSYSGKGLEQLSHTFHDFVRNHIISKKWHNTTRPIVLNNWEATYFDFTEDKIVELAKQGSELGIEMFVLDDGWFGNRNSDQTGLGDWFVNRDKLPNGIEGLSKRVHDLGMQFGLWIEPEMINKGTLLYENHQDWLIGHPDRAISHGRNQYVLDYSNQEVVDHILNQLINVLDNANVDYIKWDMNKNITEAYSKTLARDQQGELFHRYILGVYYLYEKLIDRYPNILIESCASGGGRFDLAMMYYAPQAWTSDNTDAVERLKIQHTTSLFFPLITMASHISDVPNHQVGRMTSLKMRGDVANFGTFGYELDLTKLQDAEKVEIKEQVKTFKSLRELIHHGEFYRLISPFENDYNNTAWQVVSKDGNQSFVTWYQVLSRPNEPIKYLKLRGLEVDALYQITGFDEAISGSYLMYQGLLIEPSFNGVEIKEYALGDFQSRTFVIKKVNYNL